MALLSLQQMIADTNRPTSMSEVGRFTNIAGKAKPFFGCRKGGKIR
jgi:hypothetical protein